MILICPCVDRWRRVGDAAHKTKLDGLELGFRRENDQIHAKAAAWLEKELQKNKDNYEAAVEELENEGGGFESSGGESDSSAACQRRQGGRARRLPGSDYLF